jgi:hypothetical protein
MRVNPIVAAGSAQTLPHYDIARSTGPLVVKARRDEAAWRGPPGLYFNL